MYRFVRYSIDRSYNLELKDWDWNKTFDFAIKQSLVGVLFKGIERAVNNGVLLPKDVVLNWIGMVSLIKTNNQRTNQQAVIISETLSANGFHSCVLKGQGNAIYYSDPSLRMPGDIDIWVKPNENTEGICNDNNGIRRVIQYVKKKNPQAYAIYHHIDYGPVGDVEVEVHYRPSYMSSPIHNRRAQKWFHEQQQIVFNNIVCLSDGVGEISVPTNEFNLVYLLMHMMRHLFNDGIGLRQMMDYYYLLKSDTQYDRKKIVITLKKLGLYHYAGAVMYVLRETMGLDDEHMVVKVDERRGKFLLEEILRGGNFGKYDTNGYFVKCKTPLGSLLRHVERDLRLVRYFPSEALWEPVSRIYHHFWRKRYN